MSNKIEPTYHTPNGTLLIPRDSIEAEVKKWTIHNVLKAYRRLLDFVELPSGSPCPCCRRPLELAIRGPRYEQYEIGPVSVEDLQRQVDLR